MLSHTTLVPVPTPGVGSPGRVALHAGAGEAAHGVGTDGVPAAVVWKVPVSALVNIHTALVRSVVTIASVTVASPAPNSVHTGSQGPAVGGGGGVNRALVDIGTTFIVKLVIDFLIIEHSSILQLITSFCSIVHILDHRSYLLISTICTTHFK